MEGSSLKKPDINWAGQVNKSQKSPDPSGSRRILFEPDQAIGSDGPFQDLVGCIAFSYTAVHNAVFFTLTFYSHFP